MATITETLPPKEEPQYEYFNMGGQWGHKREILKGDRRKETFDEIPIVDLAGLREGSLEARMKVAKDLAHCCQNVGFFYIKNHGIDQELIDATLESNRRYFEKPLDVKMKEYIYNSRNLRGYEPVHGARVDRKHCPGETERSPSCTATTRNKIPVVPELTPEQLALQAHNLWPEDDPELKRSCYAYDKALLPLARSMMRAFALGLGEEESVFDSLITAPNTSVKKLHYPPQDISSTDETGIGAHTDFVCFTILLQNDVGGLEVLNANAEWIPAPPIPGTFVVNIGDFLMRMTNHRFLSTVHRVKNLTGKDRYSMPFFFCFNMDAYVQTLPSCITAENPNQYEPITVSDYYKFRHELQRKTFAQRQTGDNTATL